MSSHLKAARQTAVAGCADRADWGWKAPRVLLVVGTLYTFYQITNHWHWRAPSQLPLTSLDLAIPCLAWTVWPYLALAGCCLLPLLLRSRSGTLHALCALLCGYSINLLIFAIWPTTFPRIAPAPQEAIHQSAFAWLFSVDTPANCFPSGHITGPMIGFWAIAREHPRWRWAIWGVFILLCPTILTTKQHYVVDLPGGLATGIIGIVAGSRIAAKRCEGRAAAGRDRPSA